MNFKCVNSKILNIKKLFFNFDFCFILMTLFFYSKPLQHLNFKNQFIIWNVGQGSWSTLVEKYYCIHFDSGGDRIPLSQIINTCKLRQNIFIYSHFDRDHINGAPLYIRKTSNSCRINLNVNSQSKIPKHLIDMPICSETLHQDIKKLSHLTVYNTDTSINSKNKNYRNLNSVFVLSHNVLLTGDAPKSSELNWINTIKHNFKNNLKINKIKKLIIGHHGSKTSSDNRFLNQLPKLNQCFCSSRKKRYGHPHKQVTDRIKNKKCPLLITEQWGHIHVIL